MKQYWFNIGKTWATRFGVSWSFWGLEIAISYAEGWEFRMQFLPFFFTLSNRWFDRLFSNNQKEEGEVKNEA